MYNSKIILLLSTILTYSIVKADTIIEKDFSRIFKNRPGTIVVYDQNSSAYYIYNKKRSNTRFTPFSTFKIPNSIIALETGVIVDINKEYLWDTTKYPSEKWWPVQWTNNQNMRTALKYSVVPFHRNIATKIGSGRMQEYLDRFKYGNCDISSGIDNFWLNGSIAISAMEQIEFLKKFYNKKLFISDKTTDSVKAILVREKNGQYHLSAKTGGGNLDNNPNKALGWYSGYVEKDKAVFFFVTNVEGKGIEDIMDSRIEITMAVLRELKIID